MDNDWRRRDSPAPVPPVQMAQLTDTEPMHPGLQPMASQERLLPTSNELNGVNNHSGLEMGYIIITNEISHP